MINLLDYTWFYKLFNIVFAFILSGWQIILLDITILIWCNNLGNILKYYWQIKKVLLLFAKGLIIGCTNNLA